MQSINDDNKNYYDVLEIPTGATLQDIHSAYTRAKNAYSGDSAALYSLITQNECDKILNQIEEAYSVLGIADKRLEYDKARGLNQSNTPTGFNQDMINKPAYKPNHSLTDLINEATKTNSEIFESKQDELREEYKYDKDSSKRTEVSVSKIQAFRKFGLDFKIDSEIEMEIENKTDYNGAFLQKVREYKSVSIERLADLTRISKTYIKNIEADDFTKLPAHVYTRGFVYQYAKILKLNPELAAKSYLSHIKTLEAQANQTK